jgi:hypothetical protein
MSDSLVQINSTNCKSKTLEARVLFPQSRGVPGKEMTIFGCTLVAESGFYTRGEAVIFGNTQQRAKVSAVMQKNFDHESAYTFTKMSMQAKKPAFQSCPHGYILNLGEKSLVTKKLTGTSAQSLPMEAEPPMTTVHLLELQTSQLVDTTAVATAIGDPKPQKNGKSIIEVTLSNETGKEIPLNFWDENQAMATKVTLNKPIYIYGAYLVAEESGGRHLTARTSTSIVEATGTRPLAAAMSAANIASLPPDQKENLSKWDSGTSHEGPAVNAHLGMLESAAFFKQPLPDSLFEVCGAVVTLEDTAEENLLTKGKERIWTKVTVTDFANTITADIGEKSALLLTDTSTKDEFVQQAASGFLAFDRAHLRVRWATPAGCTDPKLTIVAALPRLFDPPENQLVPASDTRILPVKLAWAAPSPTGHIKVTFPGTKTTRLASGVLAVVRGAKEPWTGSTGEGFAIRSFVVEAWGDNQDQPWEAVTSAIPSRLARYALPKKEMALVHVTHIDPEKKELTVADVWKIPCGTDLAPFEQEVSVIAEMLKAPTHGIKRKLDEFTPTLQGLMPPQTKKIHAAFGEPASAP